MKWHPECSNCGAHAVERELDEPVWVGHPEDGYGFEKKTEIVCPYGCIDEGSVV